MKKTIHLATAVLASSLFAASVANADTVLSAQYDEVVAVTGPQLKTSVTGSIEITSTGKINANNTDGIQVDSAAATITIDANNTTAGNNAIIASGALGNGINILNGAGKNTGTIITINSGSNISTTGTGHAIIINDLASTVTNSGKLLGGGSAVDIPSGGVNTSITNTGSTALMQGGFAAAAPTIMVEGIVANGGTGLTLNNTSGALINATGGNDAIQINQSFTLLNNDATSAIKTVNGNGINLGQVAVGAITGDVENYGLVQATGGGAALKVSGVYNGVINNNSGATFENNSNSGGGGVVVLNSSFNTLNNAGTIKASGNLNYLNAILVSNIAPGTINNSGLIQSTTQGSTIFLNGSLTSFNNTGSIIGAPSGAAINEGVIYAAANNITMQSGFVNSGIITSTTAAPAINFSTIGNNVAIPFFQQGGTVTGNVLLSSNSSQVDASQYALTMTGGTITGNVSSSSANPSTLQLSGGTINGNVTLGNIGAGTNVVNLSGGSFTTLNGGGGNDILNVLGNFTQNNPINAIQTINVQNNGFYVVNNQITGTSNFNINAGGSMVTNFNTLNGSPAANINIAANGALTVNTGSTFTAFQAFNNGSLTTQPGGTLSLTGNYLQNAGAAYYPVVSNGGATGLLSTVGTATFAAGSTMNPVLLTGGVFVPPGSQYTVVNATGGVVGAPTVVQPQSALVLFDQTVNANNIVITLELEPIAGVAQGDTAQAIGAALDPLLFGGTTNPELAAVLGQLELMPDETTLTLALLQLAPSLNNALPTSSRICMDNALDSVQQRLEQLHGIGPFKTEEEYRQVRDDELYNGVNYGDINVVEFGANHFNAWAKVYGTIVDQHKREQVEGFLANAAGLGIGWDWRLTNQALVGLALSGNKVETTDDTTAQNKIETWSYQATFYGWFEPFNPVYIDAMLAVASHKYDTIRNMQIGSFVANSSASFLGTQYGVQTDIGYAINEDNWLVAPYVRGRYTYLHIADYSEVGAGGINLSVQNGPIDEMIAGIGLRVAAKRDFIQAVYVPEATATLLYDFAGKEQAIQSTFLGGGGFFYVNGIKPAQIIQQYSFGVNAYTNDGYNAALKFTFEYRNEMFAYNGYLQLSYQWD